MAANRRITLLLAPLALLVCTPALAVDSTKEPTMLQKPYLVTPEKVVLKSDPVLDGRS